MDIITNVNLIRAEIDKINPNCRIVAATKTRVKKEIDECMSTGKVLAAGENRVQELIEKYTTEYRWDFIGRLQTNKVKFVVGRAEIIHSLDRIELAEEIRKECQKKRVKQKVLIEINVGEEESKGGIMLNDLDAFLEEISKFEEIEVKGLMAVVPLNYTEDELKMAFESVYEEYFKRKTEAFNELSMGMSGDYLIGAECGATMVRIGRAIFGERSYQKG